MRRVLDAIPRQADRDLLYFGLQRHLGLWPGEALAVNASDLADDATHLSEPGRGGRRRTVLITDVDIQLRLENWSRDLAPGAYLFPGRGERGTISYQALLKRWNHYCGLAGVQVPPGALRQAHHDDLIAAGVPLWVIGERLGVNSFPASQRSPGDQLSDELLTARFTTEQRTRTQVQVRRRTAAE